MVRVLTLTLLWLMQAGLVLILVNAEWLDREARSERVTVAEHLGIGRYAQLEARARVTYDKWFVATRVRDESYARLLPEPSRPKDGMENLAPWFFKWLKERLDVFWSLVFQAFCRVQLLREWGTWILVVTIAAICDGFVQRRIKAANHGLASADKYAVARNVVTLVMFAPFLYLSMPISVTPIAVPVWGAILAIALMLLTAHAQHRV